MIKPLRGNNCRTMAPRVHLLWCALACAARSTAERSLADPASFVVEVHYAFRITAAVARALDAELAFATH